MLHVVVHPPTMRSDVAGAPKVLLAAGGHGPAGVWASGDDRNAVATGPALSSKSARATSAGCVPTRAEYEARAVFQCGMQSPKNSAEPSDPKSDHDSDEPAAIVALGIDPAYEFDTRPGFGLGVGQLVGGNKQRQVDWQRAT